MKTNMYDYICETPDVLTYIINNSKEIVQEFVNEYKDKKIDQIYVIGSGTSYHAGLSAKKVSGTLSGFFDHKGADEFQRISGGNRQRRILICSAGFSSQQKI